MDPGLCYDVSNTAEERRDMMIDLTRHHLFDGGMGTMLQAKGLEAGHAPELLNLTNPDIVVSIHAAYADAGADILIVGSSGLFNLDEDINRAIDKMYENYGACIGA